MRRFVRFGLAILAVVLVLAIIIAVAIFVVVRRPFPQTDGTVTVAGLNAEVEIYRDEFGIPHIYAQNQNDLFFAQGYVHAQDRFWQMEFWRHIGQGRLSEISGEVTLEDDKFIRTMGWNRMAADTVAYYEREAPEFMALMEAYSAGVNAYIDEHKDELSINYTILNLVSEPWEIEPWEPIDTASWGVVMSDVLSRDWPREVRRLELIKSIGEGTVSELVPFYPYGERPVIAPTEQLVVDAQQSMAQLSLAPMVDWDRVSTKVIGGLPDLIFLGDGLKTGSNNWVVSGEHTDSGLPLLANDPHLAIQMPSIWYEVGLHAPNWDVVGFSFAGVPGIIIGHNDRIAWGVTNAGADVQDVFIERINPDNPRQYEYMGEWRNMEVVQERIKVNGGEDEVINVRITHHGPIINDVTEGHSDLLSVQWTAAEPSRILQSVIMLNQADNYEDFREALRLWDIPSQNVVYADVEGNIAYQLPGLIPIRKQGDGLLPVPGWTGEYEWEGWIPYEELPALLNPESGHIVTANHAIVDAAYPHHLAHYWSDGDRGQRIVDMIEESLAVGNITGEDYARIQFDSKSLIAEAYVPLLTDLSSSNVPIQEALERLRVWDYQERRDSVAASVFELFYSQLPEAVLADEIGVDNVGSLSSQVFFHRLANESDSHWWDDIDTSEVETRDDILLESISNALDWLTDNVGSEMDDWSWGNLHRATFVSPPVGLSGIGLMESVVNRGPFPADGGNGIVNATGWSRSDPAAIVAHPSMRMIVDMSDLDASLSIIPTGQSGHPYHEHYDDEIELWLNGEFHSMLIGREAIEAAAKDLLILQPAN
jgi:penicillin amidase